jgi:hypothetical protein
LHRRRALTQTPRSLQAVVRSDRRKRVPTIATPPTATAPKDRPVANLEDFRFGQFLGTIRHAIVLLG